MWSCVKLNIFYNVNLLYVIFWNKSIYLVLVYYEWVNCILS